MWLAPLPHSASWKSAEVAFGEFALNDRALYRQKFINRDTED
jgi:hypothetical protein